MSRQKQLTILIVILIIIIAVWAIFFRETKQTVSPVTQPTVVQPENGNSVPKLNNTLETSVTVVEPSDVTE